MYGGDVNYLCADGAGWHVISHTIRLRKTPLI